MTKREKTLAMLIGVLLIALVGWSGIRRIRNTFDTRHAAIDRLEGEIGDLNFIVDRGTRAASEIAELEKASLPGDPGLARSLYQGWLLELAQEKVGLAGVNVVPQPSRPVGNVYYRHAFNVNCDGDLRQLTEFLHAFYSAGFLHRISRLHVKPQLKSNLLTLAMTVDAVSLTGAPNVKKLTPPPGKRLAATDLEAYTTSILNRNMFSPANKAPQLASIGTQVGNPMRSLRFQVNASDPENDPLRYEFDGEVLEGAELNERTGEVTFLPKENGEYLIAIRVTDSGLPARSDTANITIHVEDPPPEPAPTVEPPGFDPATQAVVTGITAAFGQRQLFITVQTEGKILKLREGDAVNVGTIKGTVKRIGISEVEIGTDDGKSIVVQLGDSLVDDRA